MRRHLVQIAAAAALGKKERLSGLYRAALDDGVDPQALLEAALQVIPFAGFPRTIDALLALREHTDVAPLIEPPGDHEARGRGLFQRIYEGNAAKVEAMLTGLHPDFARFTLAYAYGDVMTRPFLEPADRELMAIAMLSAMGLKEQLKAHVKGALRCGASAQAIREAAAEAPGEQRAIVEEML